MKQSSSTRLPTHVVQDRHNVEVEGYVRLLDRSRSLGGKTGDDPCAKSRKYVGGKKIGSIEKRFDEKGEHRKAQKENRQMRGLKSCMCIVEKLPKVR